MGSDSPYWQKLRGRPALPTNELCLIDLDERLQVIEANLRQGSALALASDNGADPTATWAASEPAAVRPQESLAPIPIAERLPELHELDRHGRCWAYRSTTHDPLGRAWVLGTPVSLQLSRSWCSFTHWLPHWALPILEEEISSG